jgi:peptidoglycan/xylan/chitin deacetylase (PgdA/CDA1 family)
MGAKQTPSGRKPQQRKGLKLNYRRVAFALLIAIFVTAAAVYSGYSIARIINAPSKKEAVAQKKALKDKALGKGAGQTASETRNSAATTTTTEQGYVNYTVRAGDTFYNIAKKFNTTVMEIKKLNGVAGDDNMLHVGTVLKIPSKNAPPEALKQAGEQSKSLSTTGIKASSKEISRGPATSKKVALTFDAGSGSESTPQILKALQDANIKATFFLTGKWVEENPALAKQIASDGHVIGNHTYSHPDLTKQTDNNISYQLRAAEGEIAKVTGFDPKPLFRPPYGARDARVLRVAAEAGYTSIYWTVDSLDWKPDMTPAQVKDRVLAGLGNGAIVLMHCGSNQTAQVLPQLISEIKSRGYQIVAVPELFN